MAGFQTMSGIPKVTSTANFYSNTNPLLQSRGIGGFAEPSALFGNSEQGAWWDFSDLANMWQTGTATGVAAALNAPAALEQPVGFVADKRIPISGQNQIKNSDLTQGSAYWTLGATTSIANGGFYTSGTSGFGNVAQQQSALKANTWYFFRVTVNVVSGLFDLTYGSVAFLNGVYPSGTYTGYFNTAGVANAAISMIENSGGTFVGGFSNLQIFEAPGNHLIQPTAGARPILSRRYNLLRDTDAVDSLSGVWSKGVNLNRIGQERALNGKLATVYQGTGVGNNEFLFQTINVVSGSSYTVNVNARLVTGAVPTLGTSYLIAAELVSGGAKATLPFATSGLSSVEQTFTLTFTPTATGTVQILFLTDEDTTASIAVNSASVRLTADTALAMPSYQRVGPTGGTDYDTLGFPAYLLFDGATKWMQSASAIPFSGQQMTGIVGQSDFASATVMLYEHGTSIAAVDGTFNLGTAPGLQYLPAYRGTVALEALNSGNLLLPYNAVLSAVIDGTQPTPLTRQLLYSNNAQLTLALNSGGTTAGPFTSQTFYVGSRAGTSQFFNGRMFGMIFRNAATNDNDLSMTNKWMGSKCGLFF